MRSLLTVAVALSLTGCGSPYEPFLGTYRGILQRQGKQNATVILELSYEWRLLGRGDKAELSVFSPSSGYNPTRGSWTPKANNTIEASFGVMPNFGITFVQKEQGRLVAIATRYPNEMRGSRELDRSSTNDGRGGWDRPEGTFMWFGPLDGLVLVKQ